MTDTGEDKLEVSVVEVRGEKRVGFDGIEHLQVDEDVKDDLLGRYEDIILALDNLADEYEDGAERAWHIGRILDEYGVTENSDITIADIARYNSIGLNERRINFCRGVYRFFPEQGYDPSHNVTALGELASRAKNQDRIKQARKGYDRLLEAGEGLNRHDVHAWAHLEKTATLDEIAEEASRNYNQPAKIVTSIRRVTLLFDRDPTDYSSEEVRAAVKDHLDTESTEEKASDD